jgi:hypothetical protein
MEAIMGFDNISPNTLNAYLELSKKAFAYNLAAKGRRYMDVYQFPVEAMVACGCLESGWGTSPIYLATNCPFNLQRPANWEWPHCDVYTSGTAGDRAGKQKYITTFCKAIDLVIPCEYSANGLSIGPIVVRAVSSWPLKGIQSYLLANCPW